MNADFKIERVTLTGLEKLQEIGILTFKETFAEHNSEADMANYLHESFSVEKVKQELSNSFSEFYFAINNRDVIGYLKINFGTAQTEKQDANALEIERIYVLKQFHGKSAGQFLFNYALQIAQQKNAPYVWLGVWEKNERALNFYQKNGFVPFDKHIFKLGDDEQTDILMKLNL